MGVNISVILWRSVLLMEEIETREKSSDLAQVTDKLLCVNLYVVHLTLS